MSVQRTTAIGRHGDIVRLQAGRRGRQAAAGRRRVPPRRRPLRPDERPDVGRHAPAVERGRWSPGSTRRSAAPGRCSTSPAAPATSLSASSRRPAATRMRPCSTSTARCWRSAATARPSSGSRPTPSSSRPMPSNCRSRDEIFDAYTIAFGIRNVPRIETALAEAYRVLKPGGRFLCLEFSEVDMPLLDRAYEAWSFNAIPRIGQIVAGDGEPYAYLVELIRKFPNQQNFARDGDRRRLRAGRPGATIPAASRRCIRAGSFDGSLRMSSLGAGLRLFRAGWIMVREGVVAALPGDQLAGLPKFGWRVARLLHAAQGAAARPQRAACRRRHTARTVLCEARPVPGDAAGRRRHRHRHRPRLAAGPHGDLSEGRGRRGDRGLARPADRRALREFRRAGRRRLDRAGASGDRRCATARS